MGKHMEKFEFPGQLFQKEVFVCLLACFYFLMQDWYNLWGYLQWIN